MRILQVNNYFAVGGGSEVVFRTSIDDLTRNGYEVTSLSSIEESTKNANSSERHIRYSKTANKSTFQLLESIVKFFYNWKTVNELKKLWATWKPDIIHLHNYYGIISSSVVGFARGKKVPCIQTLHDYRLICPISSMLDNRMRVCSKCSGGRYYHCILKRCNHSSIFRSTLSALECFFRDTCFNPLRNVSKFICVSQFQYTLMVRSFPRWKEKFIHIYNTSNIEGINALQEKGNYFLYIGRISREKGIKTMLKAFSLTDEKIVIAGAGIQNGYEGYENAQFLGHLTKDKLLPLLKGCNYLVIPSEWYENNPLVAIEALACGKPIIGANIGGIPELIDGNGFLFQPGNVLSLESTIKKAVSITPSEYSRMCESSLNKYREQFSVSKHISRVTAAYNACLANENKEQ